MNGAKDFIIWLKTELLKLQSDVVLSFVFGSVARGAARPSDCDMLIITHLNPNMHKWNVLRENRDNLCRSFATKFNLTLSVILLTKDEYLEVNPFLARVLARPVINIYGEQIISPNHPINRTENRFVQN